MGLLDKVQRGRVMRPPRVLIYGIPGIGKTTVGANTPKPIFIPTEDGLDMIEADKLPMAQSLGDVQSALQDLHEQQHDYETVVIDSLDWLERLIWDRICAESGARTIETADGGYGRGYMRALAVWQDILAQLDMLRSDRNMIILLIAHSKVERFEDPESPPYDRYSPRLHKHAAALVTEWCDAVLFATRKFRTTSEDVGFGRKRTTAHAIGKDGGDRILRTVGGPTCLAKNRYGLVDDLPLSWQAFMNAITNK